jgi:uncharacterized protein (UPF0218 family)
MRLFSAFKSTDNLAQTVVYVADSYSASTACFNTNTTASSIVVDNKTLLTNLLSHLRSAFQFEVKCDNGSMTMM